MSNLKLKFDNINDFYKVDPIRFMDDIAETFEKVSVELVNNAFKSAEEYFKTCEKYLQTTDDLLVKNASKISETDTIRLSGMREVISSLIVEFSEDFWHNSVNPLISPSTGYGMLNACYILIDTYKARIEDCIS